MAVVKKKSKNNDKLILEFDGGDKEKFQQVLKDWNFRDEQCLLRFAISLMIKTKHNTLGIVEDDYLISKVVPNDHLVN